MTFASSFGAALQTTALGLGNFDAADDELELVVGTIEDGLSPADRLLALFCGPWQSDIDRVFDTQAVSFSAASQA